MKVIVVDDSDICRVLVQNALASAGFDVIAVSNGSEALLRLNAGEARLVVSDWEMPGLTGPELCRSIRAADLPNYTYVILVTSHNAAHERVLGLAAGADDFVAKPFDAAELVERVRAGERILALETRDVTIFALAKLAESRDPETGAHLERVQCYVRVIAQHLAKLESVKDVVDGEFIRLIYLTSPLHDIGKVGIPDVVLLKPDRLSDQEFAIMKTHAMIGAKTLDAALEKFPDAKFLRMARDIAATHHERWNGSGYPAGLSGEDIPLSGRIMAIADVYDALTSKRVYKGALSHEVARAMITKEAGAHFDPILVQAFLSTELQFKQISERFREMDAVAA